MVRVHVEFMERFLHEDFVVWYGNNCIGMHVGTGYVVWKGGLRIEAFPGYVGCENGPSFFSSN